MLSYYPRKFIQGEFPRNIMLNLNVFDRQFNLNLYQIQGLVNNASLNSQVWIKNNAASEINELESENLVKSFFCSANKNY
jgi:hypothetical protein